jgi:hypothetical protein
MDINNLKIGDRVWWATCGTKSVIKTCPVCFGKRQVGVILGDGTVIYTPCNFCGKGYEGARGVIEEYEWVAACEEITIDGKSVEEMASGQKVEYNYCNYRIYPQDLFLTKEEAEKRCAENIEKHNKEQAELQKNRKTHSYKSYSWHVGYHRKEAERARKSAEWHEARAIACKALVKT